MLCLMTSIIRADDYDVEDSFRSHVASLDHNEAIVYRRHAAYAVRCATEAMQRILKSTPDETLRARFERSGTVPGDLIGSVARLCRESAHEYIELDPLVWIDVRERVMGPFLSSLISDTQNVRLRAESVAIDECDALAANPTDAGRSKVVAGVPYNLLRKQAFKAVEACRRSAEAEPSIPRFRYQLARALQAQGSKESRPLLEALVRERYPAAFDNLANLMLSEPSPNYQAVGRLLRDGSKLGDPGAKITLANLIINQKMTSRSSIEPEVLYREAAGLGHLGAVTTMKAYDEMHAPGGSGYQFWLYIRQGR